MSNQFKEIQLEILNSDGPSKNHSSNQVSVRRIIQNEERFGPSRKIISASQRRFYGAMGLAFHEVKRRYRVESKFRDFLNGDSSLTDPFSLLEELQNLNN